MDRGFVFDEQLGALVARAATIGCSGHADQSPERHTKIMNGFLDNPMTFDQ